MRRKLSFSKYTCPIKTSRLGWKINLNKYSSSWLTVIKFRNWDETMGRVRDILKYLRTGGRAYGNGTVSNACPVQRTGRWHI
jgi:hypothetical protein